MVKIRLARHGRKKSPFYQVVVADSRSPRNGRFIEKVGHYNPLSENHDECTLNMERINHWIGVGAKPSNRVASLIKQVSNSTKDAVAS